MKIRPARLVPLDGTKRSFVPEAILGQMSHRVFVLGSGPQPDFHIKRRGIGTRRATFRYRPETESWSVSRHFFQVAVNGRNLAFWQSVRLKDGDRIQVSRFYEWTFEFSLKSSKTAKRTITTDSLRQPGENEGLDMASIKMELTRIRREKYFLHGYIEEGEEVARKLIEERDRLRKQLDAERSLLMSEQKRNRAELERALQAARDEAAHALRGELEEEFQNKLSAANDEAAVAQRTFEEELGKKLSVSRGEAAEARRERFESEVEKKQSDAYATSLRNEAAEAQRKFKEELKKKLSVARGEAAKTEGRKFQEKLAAEKRQMKEKQKQIVAGLELKLAEEKASNGKFERERVKEFFDQCFHWITCWSCHKYLTDEPVLLECGHVFCDSCSHPYPFYELKNCPYCNEEARIIDEIFCENVQEIAKAVADLYANLK